MKGFFSKAHKKKAPSLQQRYPQYVIGRGSYGKPKIHSWGEGATLEIGAFCSIASGVQIFLGGEHRWDWATTYPFSVFWPEAQGIDGHPKTKGDVCIGSDVWIGAGAMIMSGVRIADGAVVGASALVSRDVPAYGIVAGNPATLVRKRFDEHTIARLLAVRWWLWDDQRIKRLLPLMLDQDIETFLLAAEAESGIAPGARSCASLPGDSPVGDIRTVHHARPVDTFD